MKMMVRTTVTFEWEESSDYWDVPESISEEDLLKHINDYAKDDRSYILEQTPIFGPIVKAS